LSTVCAFYRSPGVKPERQYSVNEEVKRILIASCWIAVVSYCALSALVGPSGLASAMKVASATERMRRNASELSSLNARYSAEWESLRTESEAAVLEARSLGYLADDEVAVRLSVGTPDFVPPTAGERLSYQPQSVLSERRIKEIAALAGLLTVVAGMAIRLAKPRQREILTQEASRT